MICHLWSASYHLPDEIRTAATWSLRRLENQAVVRGRKGVRHEIPTDAGLICALGIPRSEVRGGRHTLP
jgi:hypothetical protein